MERRRHLRLREAVESAPPPAQIAMKVLISRVRKLGPDEIGRVESIVVGEQLGDMSREERIAALVHRGKYRKVAETIADRLDLSINELPKPYLRWDWEDFSLSGEIVRALSKAGIEHVGEFALRTKRELRHVGLPDDVIQEVKSALMLNGIRTIENPPSNGKSR